MSIFPSSNLSVNNDIEETKTANINIGDIIDMEFKNNKASIKVINGVVVMATTLKRKIEVYIQTLLRTEINKYNVYKDNGFGVDYFRFIGHGNYPFAYVKAEIQRTIETKALMFRGIKSTKDFTIELERDKLKLQFTIITIDDDIINITERGI